MNGNINPDLEKRLSQIEDVLASAGGGDLDAQISIDLDNADALTSVETGINLIIADLRSEVAERKKLAEELKKIKGV